MSRRLINYRIISAIFRFIGAVIIIVLLYWGVLWMFDALGGNQR